MSNEVRDNRLAFELEKMKQLTRDSSFIKFRANDEHLPDEYYVEFHCAGLAYKDQRSERHLVHIYLTAGYPRSAPVIRFRTPIFHPNIKALLDDSQDITQFAAMVGGPQNLEQLYHRNPAIRELFDAHICLDVLGENWTPAVTLYDICLELGAMIQFQRYNKSISDALNKEAATWAEWAVTQNGLLPVDQRDLRDRLPVTAVKKAGKATIRILAVEKIS